MFFQYDTNNGKINVQIHNDRKPQSSVIDGIQAIRECIKGGGRINWGRQLIPLGCCFEDKRLAFHIILVISAVKVLQEDDLGAGNVADVLQKKVDETYVRKEEDDDKTLKKTTGAKKKQKKFLPAAKWALVYRALKPLLRPCGDLGEGRLDFYHRSISKAVRRK